jgi:hypothetical protein
MVDTFPIATTSKNSEISSILSTEQVETSAHYSFISSKETFFF